MDYHFNGFSPPKFNCRIVRHFFELTNVQELGITYLNIPKFMPRIRRYFRHFLPTVQSLALREPKGSRRQIIYFIGLFQHLEDLKLLYDSTGPQKEPADDLTPVPPFAPPLRGQLTMTCFTRVELLKDMIDLFGGLRFRRMELCNVDGMRLLLDACAKTLETLQLYPLDPRGEGFSLEYVSVPANAFTATTSLQDFDLSQNKSLRTLEITARSSYVRRLGLLTHVLSTVTSPVPPKIVIIYREYNFPDLKPASYGQRWRLRPGRSLPWSWDGKVTGISWPRVRFGTLREIHEVRNFQLELCADVWGGVGEYAVQSLRQAVAVEEARRGFDDTFPEPLVFCRPRVFHGEYMLEAEKDGSSDPWIPL